MSISSLTFKTSYLLLRKKGSLIVEKNTAFKKGDLVRHKIFGTGRVTGVSKSGREFKLQINFAGTKRDILASFVERL